MAWRAVGGVRGGAVKKMQNAECRMKRLAMNSLFLVFPRRRLAPSGHLPRFGATWRSSFFHCLPSGFRRLASRSEQARQGRERLLGLLDQLLETLQAAQGIKAGVLADHIFKRLAAAGNSLAQGLEGAIVLA